MAKNFVEIKFTSKNIDIFYVRASIFQALKSNLPLFKGNLLDVGCGKMPYRDYVLENSKVEKYSGLDIETGNIYDLEVSPDYLWDGQRMPFEDSQFQTIIATEVLEHCPYPEVVLKEIYRVLKKDGVFFLTVPFLWNLHEIPNDEYRYTPYSLERHLRNSGFNKVELKPTGGWHASMAQMLGLWIKRSPLKENRRRYLARIIKPIMKYLIKIDNPEKVKFLEGQMITGIYGIIKK